MRTKQLSGPYTCNMRNQHASGGRGHAGCYEENDESSDCQELGRKQT